MIKSFNKYLFKTRFINVNFFFVKIFNLRCIWQYSILNTFLKNFAYEDFKFYFF